MSLHALVEKWRAESAARSENAKDKNWAHWVRENEAGRATALRTCADELESALGGGGEAFAWLVLYGDRVVGYVTHESKPYATLAEGETLAPVFTHPAGAAQVDDAMVERALAALEEAAEGEDGRNLIWQNFGTEAKRLDVMRAAITAALNPGGSRE